MRLIGILTNLLMQGEDIELVRQQLRADFLADVDQEQDSLEEAAARRELEE